ncbi:MAG: hypothetical protein NW201_10190 [Gemmatimonadales bacterium]|nr:hypothetical protein [Gemmatimonadales bacterium]
MRHPSQDTTSHASHALTLLAGLALAAGPAAAQSVDLTGTYVIRNATGSGSFNLGTVTIQQRGPAFTADIAETSLADKPGDPPRRTRITGWVDGMNLQVPSGAYIATIENGGQLIRPKEGDTFWARVQAAAAPQPAPAPAAPAADQQPGRTVTRVAVGPIGSGSTTGILVQVAPGQWAERTPTDPTDRFRFTEFRRDTWVITLRDASRNVMLRLDLLNNRVLYAEGEGAFQPIYDIRSRQ